MNKLIIFLFVSLLFGCNDSSTNNEPTTISVPAEDAVINSLSYPKSNFELSYQITMPVAFYPTYYGAKATSFSISPSLPTGMSFSSLSGRIAGTPEELILTPRSYIITASNNKSSATYEITLSVKKQAPFGLRYNTDRVDMLLNTTDLSLFPDSSPGVRGGATIDSFTISPSLPQGLTFSTSTGSIEGRPVSAFNDITYTITGRNSGGAISTTLIMSAKPILGQIIAGGKHTCAMIESKLNCWGDNTYGQLGLNMSTSYNTPKIVDFTFDRITKLTLGSENTCVAQADSKLYCWGRNKNTQFGELSEPQYLTPTLVTDLIINGTLSKHGYNKLGSLGHSCSVTNGGIALCFGEFTFGNLSSGDYFFRKSDGTILTGITSIKSGNNFVCALTGAGTVYCLGDNSFGQLGNGLTSASSRAVVPVGLESGVFQIDAGENFACAIKQNGSMLCWGDNSYGQLGANSYVGFQSNIPINVEGLVDNKATNLSIGGKHICAISNNMPYCWGDNSQGQLGIGSAASNTKIPTLVKNGLLDFPSITYISLGEAHSCVESQNTIYCWGLNDKGQLGNGTNVNSNIPKPILISN